MSVLNALYNSYLYCEENGFVDQSDELILELKVAIREYKILQIKKLLKKLQRYIVNVYNKKKFSRFIEEYKEYGISILLDGYYGETGIEIEELATLII